jgi:hypothetical protein
MIFASCTIPYGFVNPRLLRPLRKNISGQSDARSDKPLNVQRNFHKVKYFSLAAI